MATCCAPACSQALPVKPQGVWARGSEAWAGSRDRRNLEFLRWGSSGPSSLMRCVPAGLVQLMTHKWRCATISNEAESFHKHQQATSHYLNQCWNIVNGTVRNKFQWYIHRKVKPIGHIWGLELNWYVCFSFHGYRITFGWDTANSIVDLENSRSRSWPRSNPMFTLEFLISIDMFAFRFVAIRPFLADIYLIYIYSKFHIWKFKVKVMTKVKPDVHIWGIEFNRCVCFSFRGDRPGHFWLRYSKFHIWPWEFKAKVATKIDQNLIR